MVNGVLLLHKPVGMTSHDCVMKIRKLLKKKSRTYRNARSGSIRRASDLCRKSDKNSRILN